MARKLIVSVVADTAKFIEGMAASSKAVNGFAANVTKVSVSTEAAAKAQVAAAIKTTESLKAESAAYHALAASAVKGSQEQIAASNLAAAADRKLAASMGVAATESKRLAVSGAGTTRELERISRGALSGTGIMHGFGRSLAFASGGFLAFEGVTKFLSDSISTARDAEVAQRSLAAQMKAGGESFDEAKQAIGQAELSLEKYGFTSEDSARALTVLDRGTGSITKAMSLQQGVADLARAKNLDLASAANVVAKVFGGQETALRRAVPGLEKQAHGMDLVNAAFAKLSGQAAAGTEETQKFSATLHDTEVVVGEALLPTVNKYLESLSKWLQRSNESGATQRNIAAAVTVLTTAMAELKTVVSPLANLFKAVDDAVGSSKVALEALTGAVTAWIALKWATGLANAAKQMQGLTTATELNTTANEENAASGGGKGASRLGKAGLAGQTLLSSYTLTSIGLHATGLDKKLGDLGGGLENVATKFGLVNDKMAQFEGSVAPTSDLAVVIKAQARALSGAGVDMAAALAKLEALHPEVAVRDLQVMAGMLAGINPATNPFAQGPIAPAGLLGPPPGFKVPAHVSGGVSVEQSNKAFDAAINRQLGRVQDIASVSGQITRLQQISALVTKRLAATKDVTRKLNLEDTALGVFRQIKQARVQQQQDAVDALTLNVDRAGLTESVNDDIAALQTVNAKLAQQNQLYGVTTARTQQIIANEGQLQQLRQQQQQDAIDALSLGVDRAALTKTLTDDMAAWQAVNAGLERQNQLYGVTKDRTRSIIQNEATIQGLQQQQRDNRKKARDKARQNVLDQLQFNVDRTQLTKTLQDDLAALQAQKAGIEKQIEVDGETKALQDQLLTAELAINSKQQEIKDARKARVEAAEQSKRDWAQLAIDRAGLTTTLTDDLSAARQYLALVEKQLSVHGKTLALERDKLDALTKIRDIQQQQADAAKKADEGTRELFQRLSASAFVNRFGAGLSRAQKQRLEVGFAMTGPGGTVPAGHSGQFTAGVTINGGVHMHGVQDVAGLENQLAKRAKARPAIRRGTRG